MKYQVVSTPNGLMLHVAGPIEGRRHDWALYVHSDVKVNLLVVLEVENVKYRIYGDSIYNQRWYMEVLFQGALLSVAQAAFNAAMSRVRITVYWIFKEVKMCFTTVDYKSKMKVNESSMGLLYLPSMLLCNFRNCIYPNKVAQYFDCRSPTHEQYTYHKQIAAPVMRPLFERPTTVFISISNFSKSRLFAGSRSSRLP